MDIFTQAWQYLPYRISPNLIEIGSFQLRYYSLMYLVAFGVTYALVNYRIKTEGFDYKTDLIQDYFVWAILGLIFGARFGYVLFYNASHYMQHPLEIILPFEWSNGFRFVGISGMSYHGGVLGILIASIIFCRKQKIEFWRLADLFCPAIPLGYTFGRIGNFINGELYGRATNVAWGMYFPLDEKHQFRHPSQLYEAFFEGIVLFTILWTLRKGKRFDGFLFGLYIIGYGLFRFIIEFFREPDVQLGYVIGYLSMGQILCIAMMIIGVGVLAYRGASGQMSGVKKSR
jgi:phosphatidylglycerol:prolipoprotein diacylglycerol transferase